MSKSPNTSSKKICTTTVLDMLTAEYQGEVTALAELALTDEAAAVAVLRPIILNTKSIDEEDAASRIALALRDHFGLDEADMSLVTELTPADNDRFDSVCAALLA